MVGALGRSAQRMTSSRYSWLVSWTETFMYSSSAARATEGVSSTATGRPSAAQGHADG